MSKTGTVGKRAENLAADYLASQGLKLLQRNFNCRLGEIDLIMQHGDYLVFVEVRYRATGQFGGALASIDHGKISRLRRTAEFYLLRHKNSDSACRFDILALSGSLANPEYEWIRDAF